MYFYILGSQASKFSPVIMLNVRTLKQAQDQIPQTTDKIIIQKQQTAEDGQKLNRAIMIWNFIRVISELRDFRGV